MDNEKYSTQTPQMCHSCGEAGLHVCPAHGSKGEYMTAAGIAAQQARCHECGEILGMPHEESCSVPTTQAKWQTQSAIDIQSMENEMRSTLGILPTPTPANKQVMESYFFQKSAEENEKKRVALRIATGRFEALGSEYDHGLQDGILAERERCARIAENFSNHSRLEGYELPQAIADKIRSEK